MQSTCTSLAHLHGWQQQDGSAMDCSPALQVSQWRLSTSAIASVAHVEAHGLLLVGCQSSEVRCCMCSTRMRPCTLTASSCMLYSRLQSQSALAAATAPSKQQGAQAAAARHLQDPPQWAASSSPSNDSASQFVRSTFNLFKVVCRSACGRSRGAWWAFLESIPGT